jgi:photosystem II stability/assembly factor-like uncharacterized protein
LTDEKSNNKYPREEKKYDENFEEEEVFERRTEWSRMVQGEREDHLLQQKRKVFAQREVQNIWIPIGPININGRIKSLAIHPTDGNIVYAGGANGGVWKTTDGGITWRSTMDTELSMAIGAIGISESNPNVVYAATGEATMGTPSFDGVGVYKTTDGGGDWDLLASITSVECSKVLVHPLDPNIVYVAGNSGLHKSDNGGESWTNILTGYITDALMNPLSPNIIYAGIWNNGVWKTTNGGTTWTNLSNGLPTGPSADWIKLAMGLNGSGGTEFLVAKTDVNSDRVFKSLNGGTSWTNIPDIMGGHQDNDGMRTWANFVAVDPNNHDVIFVGAVGIKRSSNGGTSFSPIPDTHPDHHVIVFSHMDSNVCYMATDGGVYKSTNNGQTWTLTSNDLVCTQLYNLSVAQTLPFVVGCGTQDQGFIISNGSAKWIDTNAGNEGNNFVIDPNNSLNMYAAPWERDNLLRRSTDGGTTWVNILNGIGQAVVRHLAVQPGNSNILLCTGDPRNIFRSKDQGDNWELVLQLDDTINGEKTTYVAFSLSNPANCYAATNKGRFYRSNSTGVSGTWFQPYLPADKPQTGFITCIAIAPDVIYISYGKEVEVDKPWHIYKSTDEGKHWRPAIGVRPSDSLPDITVISIMIDQHNSEVVYASTYLGMYITRDGGDSWKLFDDGMPRIAATGLDLHRNSNTLFVSTHGRGVYKRMLSEIVVLATIPDIVAIAGYYADIDQRNHVIVATSDRNIHHLSWAPVGTVHQEVLTQLGNNIVKLAGFYSDIDEHNHVIVGDQFDVVHELFWELGPVEQGELANFLDPIGNRVIVALAGFYSDIDEHNHVIVGTSDGKVHELFWTPGGGGPVRQGEIGDFSSTIVAIAGYYADIDEHNHVIVGTRDGTVYELFWTPGAAVSQRVLTQFGVNDIVALAGFYSDIDHHQHVIVATSDGKIHDLEQTL